MTAIIGLAADEIEEVCEKVRQGGDYVTIANYNSPQQVVIAGEIAGLDKAEELLRQKEVKRLKVVRLKVSAAFHSELMRDASLQFKEEAQRLTFMPAKADFYSNVSAKKFTDISADYLAAHIISPVKFSSELASMLEDGYDTFIETGPGKILSGLIKKTLDHVKILNAEREISPEGGRILKSTNVEDMKSLEKTIERLKL
jgi:[acyl-carrier-protein] S-malonyltransferase